MIPMKLVTTIGMSAAVALLAGSVFAQDAAVDVGGSVGTETGADADAAASAPEPEPAAVAETSGSEQGVGLPSAAPAPGDSDHSKMVGRFAVGYLGTQTMRVGNVDGAGGFNGTVTAPVIGGRYWLDNMVGIDAGIGFLLSSGSTEVAGTSTDKAGVTAFILHGGVPLSLADSGHFSFQIIPEANIGFAGTGDTLAGPNELSGSGFLLNVGARAGAEIQFGFIGIPELSLTGSVGLFLTHSSSSVTSKVGGTETDSSDTNFSIATTLGPDPWDLFTGSISALYYF